MKGLLSPSGELSTDHAQSSDGIPAVGDWRNTGFGCR